MRRFCTLYGVAVSIRVPKTTDLAERPARSCHSPYTVRASWVWSVWIFWVGGVRIDFPWVELSLRRHSALLHWRFGGESACTVSLIHDVGTGMKHQLQLASETVFARLPYDIKTSSLARERVLERAAPAGDMGLISSSAVGAGWTRELESSTLRRLSALVKRNAK